MDQPLSATTARKRESEITNLHSELRIVFPTLGAVWSCLLFFPVPNYGSEVKSFFRFGQAHWDFSCKRQTQGSGQRPDKDQINTCIVLVKYRHFATPQFQENLGYYNRRSGIPES
mgnify:CR=1 FL=1